MEPTIRDLLHEFELSNRSPNESGPHPVFQLGDVPSSTRSNLTSPHTPRQVSHNSITAIMATPPPVPPTATARKSRSKSGEGATPFGGRRHSTPRLELDEIERTARFAEYASSSGNLSSPILMLKFVVAKPSAEILKLVQQAQVFDMSTEETCYRLVFRLQELPHRTVFDADADQMLIDFLKKMMIWPSDWQSRNPAQTILRQSLWDEVCARLSSTYSASENWLALVDFVVIELLHRHDFILARSVCKSSAALRSQTLESISFAERVIHSERAEGYAKNIESIMAGVTTEAGYNAFGNIIIDYFGKLVALPAQVASPVMRNGTSSPFCLIRGPRCTVCSCWKHLIDRVSILTKGSNGCDSLLQRLLLEVDARCNIFSEVSTLDELTIFARFAIFDSAQLVKLCCDRYMRAVDVDDPSFVFSSGEHTGLNTMQIACRKGCVKAVRAMVQGLPPSILKKCLDHTDGNGKRCIDIANEIKNRELFDLLRAAHDAAAAQAAVSSTAPSTRSTPMDRARSNPSTVSLPE